MSSLSALSVILGEEGGEGKDKANGQSNRTNSKGDVGGQGDAKGDTANHAVARAPQHVSNHATPRVSAVVAPAPSKFSFFGDCTPRVDDSYLEDSIQLERRGKGVHDHAHASVSHVASHVSLAPGASPAVPERLLVEFESWLRSSFGARFARRLPDEDRSRLFQSFNTHWTRMRLRAELTAQMKKMAGEDEEDDGEEDIAEVHKLMTQSDLPANVLNALLPRKKRDKYLNKMLGMSSKTKADTLTNEGKQPTPDPKTVKRQQRQHRGTQPSTQGDAVDPPPSQPPPSALGRLLLSSASSLGGVFSSPGFSLKEEDSFSGVLGLLAALPETVDPMDEVDHDEFFYSSDSSVSDCSSLSSGVASLLPEEGSLGFGSEVSSDDERLRDDQEGDWGFSQRSSSSSEGGGARGGVIHRRLLGLLLLLFILFIFLLRLGGGGEEGREVRGCLLHLLPRPRCPRCPLAVQAGSSVRSWG